MKGNKYVNKHVSVATVVEGITVYFWFYFILSRIVAYKYTNTYSYILAISISDKFVERISHLCLAGLRGICKD